MSSIKLIVFCFDGDAKVAQKNFSQCFQLVYLLHYLLFQLICLYRFYNIMLFIQLEEVSMCFAEVTGSLQRAFPEPLTVAWLSLVSVYPLLRISGFAFSFHLQLSPTCGNMVPFSSHAQLLWRTQPGPRLPPFPIEALGLTGKWRWIMAGVWQWTVESHLKAFVNTTVRKELPFLPHIHWWTSSVSVRGEGGLHREIPLLAFNRSTAVRWPLVLGDLHSGFPITQLGGCSHTAHSVLLLMVIAWENAKLFLKYFYQQSDAGWESPHLLICTCA